MGRQVANLDVLVNLGEEPVEDVAVVDDRLLGESGPPHQQVLILRLAEAWVVLHFRTPTRWATWSWGVNWSCAQKLPMGQRDCSTRRILALTRSNSRIFGALL